jgi:hypothetical protein
LHKKYAKKGWEWRKVDKVEASPELGLTRGGGGRNWMEEWRLSPSLPRANYLSPSSRLSGVNYPRGKGASSLHRWPKKTLINFVQIRLEGRKVCEEWHGPSNTFFIQI